MNPRSAVSLREYQIECLDAIEQRYAAGVRRQLVVLPTGTGKTVVFAELIRRRGGRAVVLVHRDELVRQAVDKVHAACPDARIGVVKAERDEAEAEIVVASAQTLAHRRRLTRLAGPYRAVVCDEAHHAAAPSYRRILDHLVGPETLLLGVTATPGRGDGVALGSSFDEIVYRRTLPEMISQGYLSDLRAVQVRVPGLDLGGVSVSRGDWTASGLGEALIEAQLPSVAARACLDHAGGRRTLLYTPTVQLAHDCAAALREHDVTAEALDGEMAVRERRGVLSRFASGQTTAVTNCAVLTEGYDCPAVDCIVIGRPTRSQSLYLQMIGRGTRRHPGKSDCLVIDLVGSTTRHGLVTLAELAGVAPREIERQGVAERLAEMRPNLARPGTWAGDLLAREVSLFRRRPMAWVKAETHWLLSYGEGAVVLVPAPSGWMVVERPRGSAGRIVASGLSLEWAQGVGEDLVRQRGAVRLAASDAPWRRRPASERQLDLLRRLRVRHGDLTAGEASDLISARMARSA